MIWTIGCPWDGWLVAALAIHFAAAVKNTDGRTALCMSRASAGGPLNAKLVELEQACGSSYGARGCPTARVTPRNPLVAAARAYPSTVSAIIASNL